MSDVFISYARQDRTRAECLAKVLMDAGLTVWWDRKLRPGHDLDKEIRAALSAAKCVVVLWSEASRGSDWVRDEADKGKSRGVLVPAFIDAVEVPLGFGQLHTVNLVDWHGEREDPELKSLLSEIAARLKDYTSAEQNTISKSLSPLDVQSDISFTPTLNGLGSFRPIIGGLMGGCLGGLVAGLIIGVTYYFRYRARDTEVTPALVSWVCLFSSMYGGALGAWVMGTVSWLRKVEKRGKSRLWSFADPIGSVFSGLVGGIATGVVAGWFFGLGRGHAFPGLDLLLVGSAVGATFLPIGAVFFETSVQWRKALIASAVSSLVVTALAAAIGIPLVQSIDLSYLFWDGMKDQDMSEAGAVVGAVIGALLGLQVGCALYMYRSWSRPGNMGSISIKV